MRRDTDNVLQTVSPAGRHVLCALAVGGMAIAVGGMAWAEPLPARAAGKGLSFVKAPPARLESRDAQQQTETVPDAGLEAQTTVDPAEGTEFREPPDGPLDPFDDDDHKARQPDAERILESLRAAVGPKDGVAASEPDPYGAQADPLQNDLPYAPLPFYNVRPGFSSLSELKEHWGEPGGVVRRDGGLIAKYAFDDFPRVEAELEGDRVTAIVVFLPAPIDAARAASALGLEADRGADVPDSEGRTVGRVFPERGALFSLAASTGRPRVGQIVLETPSAESFALRAEIGQAALHQVIADLDAALRLDKDYPHALWLRAEALRKTRNFTGAEASAARAVRQAPDVPEYRLSWARCLFEVGRYDEARREARRALDANDVPQIARARGLALMGELAATGGAHDCQKAVELHVQAIQLADPLVNDGHRPTRSAARDVLIGSHLAIARDIGWGAWQQKNKVVPMWIERAWEMARGTPEEQLRVAGGALRAWAGVAPASDPTSWIRRAREAARQQLEVAGDVADMNDIHWRLGTAYFHALQIEHRRGKPDEALQYGRLAVDELELATAAHLRTPADDYLVGWLFFQIGGVHAVHRGHHEEAVRWYEKAAPTLIRPGPLSALYHPQRHGDALVSMAVSYWEIGQREKGVELTKMGADVLEGAVQRGIAQRTALAVPYGNLAAMHDAMGSERQARRFAEMAGRPVDAIRR